MKNTTRQLFNKLKQETATANNVADVTEKFTVSPAVEQRLVEKMGESSDFLKKINIIGVTEAQGQKLGLGVGSPIASRTDTTQKDRETAYVGSLTPDPYQCVQTNYDAHLTYRMMDAWAAFADFNQRYRKLTMHRTALDRIMTGWNGTNAAAETDRAANPLLQDVNIGWLEKIRLYAPARMMGYASDGTPTSDEFKIGAGGNYATLDAAVFDVITNLLDSWHSGGDDLVVILGRELWTNHGLSLLENSTMPTERNALNTWFANKTLAGLPVVNVPFFPARGLLVTSFDNLSLYYQSSAVRRAIIDNPKRDRVEEYLSSNDAYIVEDYGKSGGIRADSILLKNAKGEWV